MSAYRRGCSIAVTESARVSFMLHEDGLVSWQASCFLQVGGRSPNLCIFDGVVKGEQQPKENNFEKQ